MQDLPIAALLREVDLLLERWTGLCLAAEVGEDEKERFLAACRITIEVVAGPRHGYTRAAHAVQDPRLGVHRMAGILRALQKDLAGRVDGGTGVERGAA